MKFWNTFFSKRKVRKNINEDKKNLSPQIETENKFEKSSANINQMKAKVGTCDKCGREIKVKAAGVKENMNLICKCGNKLILKPNKKAILQAEQIINSIEYQFYILSKRIDKSGLSEWEKMNKTELALFNFVQMSKFSKLEIVNIASEILKDNHNNSHYTAVKVLAKLNEHSCLKGLTISLYDSDEKVRFVAVNALHRQGEEGTNILNEESEKLEQKGYMEAKDLLAKSAVLYSEVKKWAIETSIKYPDEIFGVYNRVYLSEVEPHRYEHDLTNYELQKMSSELRKEGFYVYDSKLPDEGSYRGFSIRRTAPTNEF